MTFHQLRLTTWAVTTVAGLVALSSTALAQTAFTTARTATPNAAAIMKLAGEAQNRVVIAHGTGTSVIVTSARTKSGTTRITEKGWFAGNATTNQADRSDISERLALLIGTQKKNRTIRYVTAGSKLAEHASGTSGWLCGNATQLNTILVWTPNSFQTTLPKHVSRVWVAGSAAFQGSPVWKIDFTWKSSNPKLPGTENGTYLVDKHDFVVRWLTVSSQSLFGGRPMHEVSTATLTKFGKVPLPKLPTCTSSPPKKTA